MSDEEAESTIRGYLLLQELAAECRSLDATGFRGRYGDGFLLHQGELEPARRAQRPQPTIVFGKVSGGSLAPGSRRKEVLVFPVRTTGRSPYPSLITVGRTKNNDIIIADVAISKFHAFFKEEKGDFYLQDAGSRNGTFLDDSIVPDKKHGKPVKVSPGAKVRFGAVELKFVRGGDVYDLVSKRS